MDVHRDDTLKVSGDELTGPGSSEGSHSRVQSVAPMAGTGDTVVNRDNKAEAMGEPQGDTCSCDLLRSLRRAGGISISGW